MGTYRRHDALALVWRDDQKGHMTALFRRRCTRGQWGLLACDIKSVALARFGRSIGCILG